MIPIDDVIDLNLFNAQLDSMEKQIRTAMCIDADKNSNVGMLYDAGRLAMISEIRYIFNVELPLKQKVNDKQENDDE